MQPRWYQAEIFYKAKDRNTLVVLPTGAGKTLIANLLAEYRLKKFGGKVLVLAPTKPLAVQHFESFETEFNKGLLTGAVPPKDRERIWRENEILFATPQTVENDILKRIVPLEEISLIVFDEAHRAVGNYAYVFIADEYLKKAKHPLILALTASPGDSEEKILEICKNLYIKNIEYKDEKELKEFLKYKKVNKIYIDLPEQLKELFTILKRALKKRVLEFGYKDIPPKKELLSLQSQLIHEKDYQGISKIAEAIKISYAIEMLQTQGVKALVKFLRKVMKESNRVKASRNLLNDLDFREAMRIAFSLKIEHPKFEKLKELVKLYRGKKKIIFTQYRATAEVIVDYLKDVCNPVLFVGQRSGMTQKKQIEILSKFKEGIYDTLVCTSVGEEGLHIDRADVGIFFEPVPSALRTIQRRGRIGRTNFGEIYVLITKGTIDEKYYWVSYHKERKMKEAIEKVSKMLKNSSQAKLDNFLNGNE